MNDIIGKRKLVKSFFKKSKPLISELSASLGYTRKTIRRNFKQLKQEKIINNFTININPYLTPNLSYVFLEIKTNPQEPELISKLIEIPQLIMLDGIFGEFSLIALFIFRNSEEFNQTLQIVDNIMADSYFKKYQLIETIKVFKINGIELKNYLVDERRRIDDLDYQILEILKNNQRMKPLSTYEIKEMLNDQYSQSTIYNRIKKLETEDIVLNYGLTFNPKKLGYQGKFITRIKPKDPSKYNQIAETLEKIPFITDLFRIGEQYGLLAIVRVDKIEDYRKFIQDLYKNDDIEDTFTNFVLDERIKYTNFILF